MQVSVRILLVTAVTLLGTNSDAADIQQVSARGCGAYGCGDVGCGGFECSSYRCRADKHRHSRKRSRRGDYCDAGNGRRCNWRSSANDFALNWNGDCGPNGKLARWGCPLAQKLKWCCETKAYPDSGWAPPAHTPIHQVGGTYQSYGSGGWNGSYAGAPMVYQPTDTTQLGYSYGNVPTWQPDPSRIPPVPNPAHFHNRYCPRNASNGSGPACLGEAHMMNGHFIPDGVIIGNVSDDAGVGVVRMNQMRPHVAMQQKSALAPVVPAIKQNEIQTISNSKNVEPAPAAASARQRPERMPQHDHSNRRRHQSRGNRNNDGWLGLPSLKQMTF